MDLVRSWDLTDGSSGKSHKGAEDGTRSVSSRKKADYTVFSLLSLSTPVTRRCLLFSPLISLLIHCNLPRDDLPASSCEFSQHRRLYG